MWFIDTKAIDGLELRSWMGNVAETVVAKHAARMGLVSLLCFLRELTGTSHSAPVGSLI